METTLAAWNIPFLATSKNGNNFQKWKQLLAAWNIPFLATSKNGNNFQKWKQLLKIRFWQLPKMEIFRFWQLPKMETTVSSLEYSVFGNFQKWKQLLAAWNIPFLATSKNGNC